MRRPAAVARTALAALFVATTFLAGTFVAATGATAQAATSGAAGKGAVTATLVSVSPVTRPGEDVKVVVDVHNGTKKAIATPRASLSLNRYRASTRADVDAWAQADTSADVGAPLASKDDDDPLAAGATWRATITTDADTLKLSPVWGPRGLAVTVTDGAGATGRLAVVRTFLLWYPVGTAGDAGSSETVTPVGVAVAVPLTGPAVSTPSTAKTADSSDTPGATAGTGDTATADGTADAQAADDALEAATSGRLAHVVDATASLDGVTWVADPALVASASTAGGSAAAWAREVCAAAKTHDAYALPAFDVDAAALAHAGHDIPSGSAATTTARCGTSGTGTDLRHAWHGGLAWPASGSPDKATFTTAVRSDRSLVVARSTGDGPLSPVASTSTTPDAVTTVQTDAGDATALVADDQLSDLLAQTKDTTAALQLALAETAVVARQADGDDGAAAQLLVALPRGWDPDPATASAELSTLDDAPWVALQPLSTLTGADPDDAVRRAPAASSSSGKELDPESVDALLGARSTVGRFATVLDDPAAVTGPVEADTLAPLAIAYRSDTAGRTRAVASALEATRAVTSSVSVVTGSTLNIISAQGDLPVTVRNTLDQPAHVRVALRSTDPKLKVLKEPELTVPAGDTATVGVPVRAIGNGNVSAYVQLLTASGSTLTTAPAFDVRVRASWETVATTAIVVLLGLALVAGIWRTVRRGRSSARVTRAQAPEAEVAGTPEATGQVPVAPPPPGTPDDTPPESHGTAHEPARHDTEDQPSDPATPAGRSGPA